jgi:hypothetical protein
LNKESESSGCYLITSELVVLLRKLWYTKHWNVTITSLFEKIIDEIDYLRKEIILLIFGADYLGQASGANIKVKTDINFNFIKKDFVEHYNYGTIIGFLLNMNELWSKKQV